MFKNIKEVDLKFNSCQGCQNSCCSSTKFSLAPLILNDFEEVYKNFAIVFGYIGGELKAFIILNDGKNACLHLDSNGMCKIYQDRAPACRMYPISPFFDEVFVDTSCHGVNEEIGEFLCSKDGYSEKFYHRRIENFLSKYQITKEFLEIIEPTLTEIGEIATVKLFKSDMLVQDNPHLNMHRESLKFLNYLELD